MPSLPKAHLDFLCDHLPFRKEYLTRPVLRRRTPSIAYSNDESFLDTIRARAHLPDPATTIVKTTDRALRSHHPIPILAPKINRILLLNILHITEKGQRPQTRETHQYVYTSHLSIRSTSIDP